MILRELSSFHYPVTSSFLARCNLFETGISFSIAAHPCGLPGFSIHSPSAGPSFQTCTSPRRSPSRAVPRSCSTRELGAPNRSLLTPRSIFVRSAFPPWNGLRLYAQNTVQGTSNRTEPKNRQNGGTL